MADFSEAIKYVLENEGGFSNRAADRGGPTKFGITKNTATLYFGRSFTIDEMKALTVEQACEIYKKWYWEDLHLGNLNDTCVATAIFDVDVNMGHGTAIHFAEAAIGNLDLQLPKANVWTSVIEVLNAIDPDAFISYFYEQVKAHYELIVIRNPAQGPNLHGWLNRANRLLTLMKEPV